MILRKWEDIPEFMKNPEVRRYYDVLYKKKASLIGKRITDFVFSLLLLVILFPLFIVIGVLVKCTSKGPIFFRQQRVSQYGQVFQIFKFRTMIHHADRVGSKVTIKNDARITRIGHVLRRFRLDEVPQLFNIILGQMSFVGTRPEVLDYVSQYTDSMKATLLLPAGLTSLASIRFKDEDRMLENSLDVDHTYVSKVLPEKMRYNLEYILSFNFWYDIKIMLQTLLAVVR